MRCRDWILGAGLSGAHLHWMWPPCELIASGHCCFNTEHLASSPTHSSSILLGLSVHEKKNLVRHNAVDHADFVRFAPAITHMCVLWRKLTPAPPKISTTIKLFLKMWRIPGVLIVDLSPYQTCVYEPQRMYTWFRRAWRTRNPRLKL